MRNTEHETERSTSNRMVADRLMRRRCFRCDRCPANRGENANRQTRNDRHKNHRRKGGRNA